jgi:dolichol-phosphate mannosyltransferase
MARAERLVDLLIQIIFATVESQARSVDTIARMRTLANLWRNHRVVRFMFFGGSAAIVNVFLMFALVRLSNWNTPWLRNMANVVAQEISLLYSFVVYRIFVWKAIDGVFHQSLRSQVLRYHFSAGAATLTRSILIFPLLDLFSVHYAVNTFIGAGMSCLMNYMISSRYVFSLSEPVPPSSVE